MSDPKFFSNYARGSSKKYNVFFNNHHNMSKKDAEDRNLEELLKMRR